MRYDSLFAALFLLTQVSAPGHAELQASPPRFNAVDTLTSMGTSC